MAQNITVLGAAFGLGILFQSDLSALGLYIKGHGKTVFKDGRRLVLVAFLISIFLWSQFTFLGFALPPQATNICSVVVVATTLLDQFQRVALGGLLLWSVAHTTKSMAEKYMLGGLMGIRAAAGIVLTAFAKPQFVQVCLPLNKLLPAGILVIGLDAIVTIIVLVRMFTMGLVKESRDQSLGLRQQQSKGLVRLTLSFLIWLPASSLMLLGLPKTAVVFMVGLPAGALAIILAFLATYYETLPFPRGIDASAPEALSPYAAPRPGQSRGLESDRDSGSPTDEAAYNKSLFVVNPTVPSRDYSTVVIQQNTIKSDRYAQKNYTQTTVRPISPDEMDALTIPARNPNRKSSGIFGNVVIVPGPVRASSLGLPNMIPDANRAVLDDNTIFRHGTATIPSAKKSGRGFIGKIKPFASGNVRELGISSPIMTGGDESTPFARMKTVDLQQAAAGERMRRGQNAERLAQEVPVQYYKAPSKTSEKGATTWRKPPPNYPNSAIPAFSESDGSSGILVGGVSTGSSLSPGKDSVRRRSPSSKEFGEGLDKKPSIQRKNTLPSGPRGGLPIHPRFQLAHMLPPPPAPQTVMYINEIVYDNPGTVKNIIKDAKMYAEAKEKELNHQSISSARSIIHRPRPYSKLEPGAFYTSEPSPGPNHKRSKSGPASTFRKSVAYSRPSSPTNPPPLPKPPTLAKDLTRILPNNTNSMTVGEKMQYLFPAPPGRLSMSKRRSSVPSLPKLPAEFFSGDASADSLENKEKRASKRTTISTFDIRPSTPVTATARRLPILSLGEHDAFTFNASEFKAQTPLQSTKSGVRSTALSPATGLTSSASSPGGTSIWASIHSPVNAVDIASRQRAANSTYIQMREEQKLEQVGSGNSTNVDGQQMDVDDAHEVGRNLCPERDVREISRFSATTAGLRESFFLDDMEQLTESMPVPVPIQDIWHKRIGDHLPTFSEVRMFGRKRGMTMPPPTPLLLNSIGRQATVVHKVVPEVIDSPGRALEEIQLQLHRFEKPDRESMKTILRRPTIDAGQSTKKCSRIGLLENLEREMGDQQSHWMLMQHKLARDSNATLSPPQSIYEEAVSEIMSKSRSSSVGSSPDFVRDTLRRRSNASQKGKSRGSDSEGATTSSTDKERASLFQQSFREAQPESVESTSETIRQSSANFPNVKMLPLGGLGSPTPPESLISDSEIDVDSDTEGLTNAHYVPDTPMTPMACHTLWVARAALPPVERSQLWLLKSPADGQIQLPEYVAKGVRPAQRRIQHPLKISSMRMWVKPVCAASRISRGLWNSAKTRPKNVLTRPLAQHLDRRSKRATVLADIVESPKPLPDKRGTLGIFQFPWGEKSDQAVVVAAQQGSRISLSMIAAAYGGIDQSLTLAARSQAVESDDYGSSFFDAYEEENESDPEISDMDEDSEDEDFDYNTLSQIADLLGERKNEVPSRESMFHAVTETITCNYVESQVSTNSPTTRMEPVSFVPIQALNATQPLKNLLWCPGNASTAMQLHGLPQPALDIWQTYNPSTEVVVRSIRKATSSAQAIESRVMWTPSKVELLVPEWLVSSNAQAKTEPHTKLWESKQLALDVPQRRSWLQMDSETLQSLQNISDCTAFKPRQANTIATKVHPRSLWNTAISTVFVQSAERALMWAPVLAVAATAESMKAEQCLWMPHHSQASANSVGPITSATEQCLLRTTQASPAAVDTVRKPRTANAVLPALITKDLWSSGSSLHFPRNWITESSVHERSLSPYSTISSFGEDVFDATSAVSAATKASSVWSPFTLRIENEKTSVTPVETHPRTPSIPEWTPEILNSVSQIAHSMVPAPDAKRASKIGDRRSMFEAMAASTSMTAKPTFLVKPTAAKRPITGKKLQRIKASKDDWKAALVQAVSASRLPKPTTKPTRRNAASAAQWNVALDEAVRLGVKRLQRPNATSEGLETALKAADIPEIKTTWSWFSVESTIVSSPSSNGMWTKSASKLEPTISAFESAIEPFKRSANPVKSSVALPKLASTSLYTVTSVQKIANNWLEISSIKQPKQSQEQKASTWTFSDAELAATESPMTMRTGKTAMSSVEEVSLHKHERSERARSSTVSNTTFLAQLSSDRLFTKSEDSTNRVSKNWLHSQTIRKPSSLTWTAPDSSSEAAEGLMWSKKNAEKIVQVSKFEPFPLEISRPRKQFVEAEAILPRLTSNSLFTSRALATPATDWLHSTTKSQSQLILPVSTLPASTQSIEDSMWTAPDSLLQLPSTVYKAEHVGVPTWEQNGALAIRTRTISETCVPVTSDSTNLSSSIPRVLTKRAPEQLEAFPPATFLVLGNGNNTKESDEKNSPKVSVPRPTVVVPQLEKVKAEAAVDELFYLSPTVYTPQNHSASRKGSASSETSKDKAIEEGNVEEYFGGVNVQEPSDSGIDTDDEEVDKIGEAIMGREMWRYSKSLGMESAIQVKEDWKAGRKGMSFTFR